MPRIALSKTVQNQKPAKSRSRARLELVRDSAPAFVGRYADASPEKLRGGYYTPAQIAEWLCRWALRSSHDSLLEPSCGDGNILLAGVERLVALGAGKAALARNVLGIELAPSEADAARKRVAKHGVTGSAVETADFFAWKRSLNGRRFTAAVGNPPFIRYQSFPEPSRSRAMELMTSLGLHPNKLTNIWVPFVVGAVECLEPGGRLAMVIPAELLQVTYAAQLRKYLTERFAHIGIFACNELFFHQAEQEVVLVLAEGAIASPNTTPRVALAQVASVADLLGASPTEVFAALDEKDVKGDSEKWLKYFLTAREIAFMRELRQHQRIAELTRFARVDVGVVTGKNEFFVLRQGEVTKHNLSKLTTRLVSRAAHLRGAKLADGDWKVLAQSDERVHLFDVSLDKTKRLNAGARQYIANGEAADFHRGFKCRIREPWYQVPSIWTPDAFLLRQIYDFPRFILNTAGATATDTIHRVTCHGCNPEDLTALTFTHLTAASAEIEGRSYGGGVLELEPSEAERLLVPDALGKAVPVEEADKMVRRGQLKKLLAANDKLVLQKAIGLSKADCAMLEAIWIKMRDRRMSRKRRA